MKVKLAFGRDGAEVDIPSHVQVNILEPKFAAAVSSADAALAEALRQPIGSPALFDLAQGRKTAAISICDITRPAPHRVVLPHVLATLEQAGVPRSGITILI